MYTNRIDMIINKGNYHVLGLKKQFAFGNLKKLYSNLVGKTQNFMTKWFFISKH